MQLSRAAKPFLVWEHALTSLPLIFHSSAVWYASGVTWYCHIVLQYFPSLLLGFWIFFSSFTYPETPARCSERKGWTSHYGPAAALTLPSQPFHRATSICMLMTYYSLKSPANGSPPSLRGRLEALPRSALLKYLSYSPPLKVLIRDTSKTLGGGERGKEKLCAK